ncbi:1-acyl-sn-glycerol-3-phosphate acyltransferase [Arachnia propionica]|nr:lysophospholipid acyltransferase family protein [Arachnia propionica]
MSHLVEQPWQRPLTLANSEPAPWAYRLLARFVHLAMSGLVKRTWSGQENLPEGGCLVVANHISNFDVLALGEYLIWNGRWPRFLGKAEIWKVPLVGWFARQCRQIPVLRNTQQAKDSLIHARAALEAGDCVAIYPEGTITADPDGWPMVGRSGAARLALTTGVPVIPVGQIGADALLGGKNLKPLRLFSLRRRPISLVAGQPVDLSDLPVTATPGKEELAEATARIMDAIVGLVAGLRGEQAPAERWDLRVGARVPRVR